MTKILLQSYKNEYQTTPISIEDLCIKYSLDIEELKSKTDIDKWEKLYTPPETINEAEAEEHLDIIVLPENKLDKSETKILTTKEEILEDIDEFKKKAVKECLRFIKDDARYAEVKEFKDMVAIVDSIEKSYKNSDTNEGTTINVLIQNLTQKFKDTPDDC